MDTRLVQPGELDRLADLLAASRYHDYRLYPRFSPADNIRLLHRELGTEGARGVVIAAFENDRPVGAISLAPLAWDSAFFGISMGRLGTLVVDPAANVRGVLSIVLYAAMDAARTKGLQHLAARVDAEDLEAVQALESHGFRLVDCLITYLFDFRRDAVAEIKRFNPVRPYRPEDREGVLAVATQMFVPYAGRFLRDPWLDTDAARRFYLEWASNACAGTMADGILVSERRGQIVGFITWRTIPLAYEALGIRIAGHAICAVLPQGAGAYPALINTALADLRKSYDFGEMDTPIQHIVSQRVFHAVGARLVRSKYTLHWSGKGNP